MQVESGMLGHMQRICKTPAKPHHPAWVLYISNNGSTLDLGCGVAPSVANPTSEDWQQEEDLYWSMHVVTGYN